MLSIYANTQINLFRMGNQPKPRRKQAYSTEGQTNPEQNLEELLTHLFTHKTRRHRDKHQHPNVLHYSPGQWCRGIGDGKRASCSVKTLVKDYNQILSKLNYPKMKPGRPREFPSLFLLTPVQREMRELYITEYYAN